MRFQTKIAVVALGILLASSSGCRGTGPRVRVCGHGESGASCAYPDEEPSPTPDAALVGYVCFSPSDIEALLNFCKRRGRNAP